MAYNKKILIIEDDPDISMIEEAYLQASGFETKILADGMDAAQIAEEEQFDLVLLDLMLPGKSGYQICREIRDKLDIPILMVTARTESVDKVRGLGLGADDYISKPFDPAELVARSECKSAPVPADGGEICQQRTGCVRGDPGAGSPDPGRMGQEHPEML